MKPQTAVCLSVLSIFAVTPVTSWGEGDGHHTTPFSHTHFKRYHVGARYFNVYDTAIPVTLSSCPAAVPNCPAPQTAAVQASATPPRSSSGSSQSDKAVSYTSDASPLVPLGASDGAEQLFYSYAEDTYWLIGSQSLKGITKTQAADYIQKHPALFNNPAPNSSSASAAATKSPLTGRSAAIEMITSQIPATITVPDTSKPPGWADYDGDGIIDEVFPQEKTIPNPDLISALKELGSQPDVDTVASNTGDDNDEK